jgi:ribosome-binding factor A
VSQRTEKVQKLATEILGETIQRLKDPRIGFATVTAVRMSGDLRRARVLVSVLGSAEERSSTMAGLRSATPYLRMELGRQMPLKYLPELVFELDTETDKAERVEELLKQIHERENGHDRERDE